MPGRSDQQNSEGLPRELLRCTPRQVRPSVAGAIALVATGAIVVVGVWAGIEIYKRAQVSERRVARFASESVTTGAEVVRVQRRGGGNDRRSVIHYRYAAGGEGHTGATMVRKPDRDRYEVGSQVSIRYLASEPAASWMETYAPNRQPTWPAFAVPGASALAVLGVGFLIRRQSYLLAYGRPAMAVVTKVERKRSDHGGFWVVEYEWSLLSGARRTGRYNYSKKQPPIVGTPMPIVYDRESPQRNSRYPLSLVRVGDR